MSLILLWKTRKKVKLAMAEFLSLLDVCQRYRISKSTLYQWTSKDFIPHLKIGGKVLFRQRDLEKWEEASLSGAMRADLA